MTDNSDNVRDTHGLYREALVPQTEAALDAARSSFMTDRVDFSTVIEDFQMWLEVRAQLAAREAERFGTWAELQSIVSYTPSTESSDQGDSDARSGHDPEDR